MMLEGIFFVTAIICLLAAILTVSAHDAVHALLYLVTMMIAMALLLFLLGSPFAAALQIIIYAGAVMVLFVFITMMLHQGERSLAAEKKLFSIKVAIGPLLLAGLVLLELLFITLQPTAGGNTESSPLMAIETLTQPPENKPNISAIRLYIQGGPHSEPQQTLFIEAATEDSEIQALMVQETVIEEIVTVGPLTLAEHAGPINRVDDIHSVKALATLLYGPYHILVIIAAMLLLSALVSAVMITKQKRAPNDGLSAGKSDNSSSHNNNVSADKSDMALASGLDPIDGASYSEHDTANDQPSRDSSDFLEDNNGLAGVNKTWEEKHL